GEGGGRAGRHNLVRRIGGHGRCRGHGQRRRIGGGGALAVGEDRAELPAVLRRDRAEGEGRAGRARNVREGRTAIARELPLDGRRRVAGRGRGEADALARGDRLVGRIRRDNGHAVDGERGGR